MVVMETYFREEANGKKHYFSPDQVSVTKDAKGKVVSALSLQDGQPVTVGRIEKMSKSKLNGVDPQALIDKHGADTARLFALFAAPPERDLEWNEAGVEGCKRFLKRLWALAQDQAVPMAHCFPFAGNARDLTGPDQAVVRKIHATIAKATDAMEKDFAFNTTIAACMELSNELDPAALRPDVLKLGLTTLVRLLAPMVPHICAELWEMIGGVPGTATTAPKPAGDLTAAGWPGFDPGQIQSDTTEYPVQINGKIRGRVAFPTALVGAALEEAVKVHPEVQALIGGKPVKKLIVVTHKIINIVV
jgi:leucyl-tRNA synthetase